jgi:hypothetical protein
MESKPGAGLGSFKMISGRACCIGDHNAGEREYKKANKFFHRGAILN